MNRKKGEKAAKVLNLGDRLGRSPLHYAATQKTGQGLISNLLRAGAAIDNKVVIVFFAWM